MEVARGARPVAIRRAIRNGIRLLPLNSQRNLARTDFGRQVIAMEHDEPIVAVGLLTQTNLRMLGSSLKVVFPVQQNTAEFDELLVALDKFDTHRA